LRFEKHAADRRGDLGEIGAAAIDAQTDLPVVDQQVGTLADRREDLGVGQGAAQFVPDPPDRDRGGISSRSAN